MCVLQLCNCLFTCNCYIGRRRNHPCAHAHLVSMVYNSNGESLLSVQGGNNNNDDVATEQHGNPCLSEVFDCNDEMTNKKKKQKKKTKKTKEQTREREKEGSK